MLSVWAVTHPWGTERTARKKIKILHLPTGFLLLPFIPAINIFPVKVNIRFRLLLVTGCKVSKMLRNYQCMVKIGVIAYKKGKVPAQDKNSVFPHIRFSDWIQIAQFGFTQYYGEFSYFCSSWSDIALILKSTGTNGMNAFPALCPACHTLIHGTSIP